MVWFGVQSLCGRRGREVTAQLRAVMGNESQRWKGDLEGRREATGRA